jgi:hypothetical protein
MPSAFEELVLNGTWDFYNFLEWNLVVWIVLFFGGPSHTHHQLYPPNIKTYMITCCMLSAGISVFYAGYLCCFYIKEGAMYVLNVRSTLS